MCNKKQGGVTLLDNGIVEIQCSTGKTREINKLSLMTPGELEERLNTIADIIEEIDNRCMVANRPASPIQNEMRQEEITLIYKLAKGGHGNVKIGERLTVLS